MQIEEHQLLHWLHNFYGYGSWSARFWFISHDEPGGDAPEEVADKFNYFYQHHPDTGTLCDIRKLYQQVAIDTEDPKAEKFANRFDYRFGPHAIPSTVWNNLVAFEFGYDHQPAPDRMRYQCEKFVQPALKNEALIPLFPLPGSHTHAWHYNWLNLKECPFLKSQQRYESYLYPKRMHMLLSKIKEHQPDVVLMFGMKNINGLKNSIQHFFADAQFTIGKGIKLQIPQHHRADIGGTTLILTTQIPALRHGRVETGFEWGSFGAQIKDQQKPVQKRLKS